MIPARDLTLFDLAEAYAAVVKRARDRDGSGEAGQTAKQAGPVGQQPGPQSGIAQRTEP